MLSCVVCSTVTRWVILSPRTDTTGETCKNTMNCTSKAAFLHLIFANLSLVEQGLK